MAALPGMTTLEYFRAFKDHPLFQYLAWYFVLVCEWNLEDITEFTIGDFEEAEFGRVKAKCNLVFDNGDRESLIIAKSEDKYYIQSSFRVAGARPKQMEEEPK